MQYQASTNWVGLLIFFGALLYQLYLSYRRGKVEPEKPPIQRPPSPLSHQVQKSRPASGRSLEQLFEELAKGLEPQTQKGGVGSGHSGGLPLEIRRIPPSVYAKTSPPPSRGVTVESQSPSLQDDPAGLIAKGGSSLYETSVEKLSVPPGEVPMVTFSHESEVNHFSWLRERLRDRSETQRAIILSEVLQTPIAMR